MVQHDILDKAPLNDEALIRQQKLYDGSRYTCGGITARVVRSDKSQ